MIAASTGPVALDYWASKNILMPPPGKRGTAAPPFMNPDNREPGVFGAWLRLSLEELQKTGAP